MPRYRYDPDLGAVLPAESANFFEENDKRSDLAAPMVMRDISEYRTIATDEQSGKQEVIGSRSEHREFLKRNSLVEVGNDYKGKAETEYLEKHGAPPGAGLPKRKRIPLDRKKLREDIRKAVNDVKYGNVPPARELAKADVATGLHPTELPTGNWFKPVQG